MDMKILPTRKLLLILSTMLLATIFVTSALAAQDRFVAVDDGVVVRSPQKARVKRTLILAYT